MNISPELAAALSAAALAIAREVRFAIEQRQRRRGELRTRDDDTA